MSTTVMSPLGAVARGLAAAAAGTLAMDLLWYSRYRRGGGRSGFRDWDLSEGLDNWEAAPAPAHVGKRLVEGLFDTKLPDERARLTNNVTHWAYGILGGAQYGLVVGSLRRPGIWFGVPFGSAVWLSSYAVLPAAGLYQPIWAYDRRTLAKDLGAHLVYGLTTATCFWMLSPPPRQAA